jgi:hypothetical protein
VPRPSPRIQIIQRAGTPAYVRDGQVFEGGLFGGDLEGAVRGNPAAEAHAKAFKTGMIGGFITSILGSAAGVGGAFVLIGNDMDKSLGGGGGDPSTRTLGAALVVSGAAAYITGLVLMFNAQPHLWDAINVYNDGLPQPWMYPPAPAWGPPPVGYPPPAVAPPPVAPAGPVPPAATSAPVAPTPPPAPSLPPAGR